MDGNSPRHDVARAIRLQARHAHRQRRPRESDASGAAQGEREPLECAVLQDDHRGRDDGRHQEADDNRRSPGRVLGHDISVDEEPDEQRNADRGYEPDQGRDENEGHAGPRIPEERDDDLAARALGLEARQRGAVRRQAIGAQEGIGGRARGQPLKATELACDLLGRDVAAVGRQRQDHAGRVILGLAERPGGASYVAHWTSQPITGVSRTTTVTSLRVPAEISVSGPWPMLHA